ncbi:MAG: adenosine deaminase [Bdellovibrionales bacterium]|nr:adenosine deaminase [Bdellovibrionales bacterium]
MSEIKQIVKAEIHSHLELCLRPATIKELAPQFGIELPNEQTFRDRFIIDEPMKDLGSVLNKFLDTQKLLASEEILERITYEACEDAYKISNTKILELRYAPTFVQQGHENLNFEKIHAAIVKGMKKAEADFDMAVGLICIIQRILPVKEAEAVTDFAIDHKETFVGLDLADNEVGFDSKPFAPFFLRAKKAGLGITVHSGEADVPKAPRYVQDAIEYLGADRIGHGVQIYRDEKMMSYVKEKQIPLELCPTSNWLTSAISTKEAHPFKQLYDFGIMTTINTDDGGIFDVNLNQEYELLHRLHGLDRSDLEHCADYAAKVSFISPEKKQKVWPRKL